MGRPKKVKKIRRMIDQKLEELILSHSDEQVKNNFRKASEEFAKWVRDLEKRHKF